MTSVGFRWAADKKLRNALIDFADDSRHASPWAAKVSPTPSTAANATPTPCASSPAPGPASFWRCWQDDTNYNPQLHGGAMALNAA